MNPTPQPQASSPALPYSFGNPVPLGTLGCAVLCGASALGFAALLLVQRWIPGMAGAVLASLLFVGLQWVGLRWAVGPSWVALFRRPRWRDVAIALIAVPFVVGLSGLVAIYGVGASHLSTNGGIDAIATLPSGLVVMRFAQVAVQLLGEELVTILPLLATVALLHRAGMPARWAIAVAWVATALMFGALHLPTYEWNWGQALLGIGTARLVLTAVFLYTRNLWASTIAHIANDWMSLVVVLVATHMAR